MSAVSKSSRSRLKSFDLSNLDFHSRACIIAVVVYSPRRRLVAVVAVALLLLLAATAPQDCC